jgi:hypothetical protein
MNTQAREKALIAHIVTTNQFNGDWLHENQFETAYDIAEYFMLKHPSTRNGIWDVEQKGEDFENAVVEFAVETMNNINRKKDYQL